MVPAMGFGIMREIEPGIEPGRGLGMDPGMAGPRNPMASIILAMASAMAARGAAVASSAAAGTVLTKTASNDNKA